MITAGKAKKEMVATNVPQTTGPPVSSAKEKQTIEEARIYRRGVVSLRDLIAPSSLEVESSYIRLNDRFVRTVFITDYPRYISVGWFAPIINFNATLDISIYVYPVRAEIVLKQLRNKVGAIEAQIIGEHEKGAPRDPIKETALKDIERLRDDLTQGIEKFFQFALYISIYADTK